MLSKWEIYKWRKGGFYKQLQIIFGNKEDAMMIVKNLRSQKKYTDVWNVNYRELKNNTIQFKK